MPRPFFIALNFEGAFKIYTDFPDSIRTFWRIMWRVYYATALKRRTCTGRP